MARPFSAKTKEQAQAIARFLNKNPGAKSGEIAKAVGMKIMPCCALLKTMVDLGDLVRSGERCKYTYTVTAK